MSSTGQGLAPLYGIAVDLTPFDVVGAAAVTGDVAGAHSGSPAMSAAQAAGVPKSIGRSKSSSRVTVVGQNANQTLALAGAGMVALLLMVVLPGSPPSNPNRANVAVAPAHAEPASAVARADARLPTAWKPGSKPKSRTPQSAAEPADQGHRPAAPSESPDFAAEPLATTLERLQGGFR